MSTRTPDWLFTAWKRHDRRARRCRGRHGCHEVIGHAALGHGSDEILLYCPRCGRWQPRPPRPSVPYQDIACTWTGSVPEGEPCGKPLAKITRLAEGDLLELWCDTCACGTLVEQIAGGYQLSLWRFDDDRCVIQSKQIPDNRTHDGPLSPT